MLVFQRTIDEANRFEVGYSLDIKYNGHPITVYVNNAQDSSPYQLYTTLCSDVKSMAWMLDSERENAITGKTTRYGREKYVIYIYLLKEAWRLRNGKGKEYRHISGFTPKKKFYSPDYRKFDVPSEKDVRRTLYWNPNVMTDDEGEAHVVFFTNSHEKQTLDISVRGISADGHLIDWN